MEEKTILAPAISCNHCVDRIQKGLGSIPGVASVAADATSKQVTVRFAAPAEWPKLLSTLAELGYPPA